MEWVYGFGFDYSERMTLRIISGCALVGLIATAIFLFPEYELWRSMKHDPRPNPDHPSIAMVGDSHFDFPNWRRLLKCESVGSYGVSNNTTGQMLERLPEILSHNPHAVILMGGTNDARLGVEPADTLKNLAAMRAMVSGQGIDFHSLQPPPLPGRMVTAEAAAIPIFITEADLTKDRIHLRRGAYVKIRTAIAGITAKHCI
jgi:lysophospholipase L1-like esterase